ncbi:MAG: ribbon-helix-helix domain-containing protein, partial [Candidatus Hydrothermarchaeota archaeon]|nr:ribbon-helix-helix domain-containing protein [Candidatus Hydrothermarchaeota archaeon]
MSIPKVVRKNSARKLVCPPFFLAKAGGLAHAKEDRISGIIPEEDKEKIRALVERGMFASMSEFYRTAIRRLLKELGAYEKKKELEKKEILRKPTEEERKKVEED